MSDKKKLQKIHRLLDDYDEFWLYNGGAYVAEDAQRFHRDLAEVVGWKAETAEEIKALFDAGEKGITKRPEPPPPNPNPSLTERVER